MKNLFTGVLCSLSFYLFSQQVNPNPWEPASDRNATVTYRNPVIPGFYSDPSVCRAGDDYYLITSTFEYFPGVPIFHSKDLINWKQIGHCIHRKDQIPAGLNIFAATLRYHEGIFYMITTNVSTRGNFFVTATNPAGPWSDPIWIDVAGIDPDLFFDDDGRTYIISSTFELAEIDLKTGKLISEKRKVWNGTGGRYPEGPHIYKKDGFFYLMAAEGGTEEAHAVTIARSNNIRGPYIDNPANPLVTHTSVAGMGKSIQGTGHADMVRTPDDSWWMVLHGYRSVSGYPPHHILGRETCLVPVSWPKGSWPIVNGNGSVPEEMTHATLPQVRVEAMSTRTDFNEPTLGLEWNYIQPPNENIFDLTSSKGSLTLHASALKIGDKGNPSFVGRRLTKAKFSATTKINFDPRNENDEAGIILLNNGSHFDLMISSKNGKRYLTVKLQFGQTIYKSEKIDLAPGGVELRIEGTGPTFIFSYSQNGNEFKVIDKADARFLSTETVGGFTGGYVGLYALSTSPSTKAIYEWFDYEQK
jgi:alpha-N-arabinofuranosidase